MCELFAFSHREMIVFIKNQKFEIVVLKSNTNQYLGETGGPFGSLSPDALPDAPQ